MQNPKQKLIIITGILIVLGVLLCMYAPGVLAEGATIIGQVKANGAGVNGAQVTIGSVSNTTFTYNGTPGVYIMQGVPFGATLPFTATYQGHTYTDTVDPLDSAQQYYQIPAVQIDMSGSTPTPTPTPTANATVTPTPAPNATATPAPNATVTPTPTPTPTPAPGNNSTVTPAPATVTPAPTAPPAAPAQVQTAPQQPPVVQATVVPTATIVPVTVTVTPEHPATVPPALPTSTPEPTQTKSPGFEGLLALACLTGVAYLAMRKKR